MSDINNQIKLFISSKRWMKKYFRNFLPEMAFVQIEPDFKMHLSMVDVSGPSFDLAYDKRKAFYQYEKADKDLVERELKDGDVFLDIGANIGHFSFYFKRKFPNMQFHLFEPIPWLGDCIRKTIKENNLSGISSHSAALSEKSGHAEFFIDTFNDGGHSLIKEKLSGRSKAGRSVKVEVKRLDDYQFSQVDFIKVDVQGAEKLFVKGALGTLKRFRPKMLIEVSASESVEFLNFLEDLTAVRYHVYSTEREGPLSREDLNELKGYFSNKGIEDCNFLFVPQK